MKVMWCNGEWKAAGEMTLDGGDRGLLHGLGLFETMLAVDGQLHFAERHLARFHRSCERLGWEMRLGNFLETATELLVRNGHSTGRARLRLAVTAGSGRRDDVGLGADHQVWLTSQDAAAAPNSVAVNLSPWRRNEHSPLAGLKCASYAENLLALDHARRLGFQETLFLNSAEFLCEAAMANVFLVKNGTLLTPPLHSGCLPGVQREVLLEQAATLKIHCELRDLTQEDLAQADEIFLSSTVSGLLPVTQIEARFLEVGTISQLLRAKTHSGMLVPKKELPTT